MAKDLKTSLELTNIIAHESTARKLLNKQGEDTAEIGKILHGLIKYKGQYSTLCMAQKKHSLPLKKKKSKKYIVSGF